jgi:hypothetical protein
MSTDTMDEFMGVRADPVETPVTAELQKLTGTVEVAGTVTKGSAGYVVDGRLNDSFRAVNLLLSKGVAVRRADRAAAGVRPGDFIVTDAPTAALTDIAKQTGVDFGALANDAARVTHGVKRQRLAMYQRFGGGNIDEGWTRFVLEQWSFPFTSLLDPEVKAGNLRQKYDVIILPADNVATLTGERPTGAAAAGRGGGGLAPPEFRSGFGQEGVAALRAFVEGGGTLITFGEAGALPIDRFGLPLRNVVANVPSKTFWSPGSTLKVKFDNTNPLAYGMPDEGLALFLAGSQAYEIVATDRNERVETIATFVDRDILQSGWLLGEQVIARKAAMVSVQLGEGKVVLIGVRPQHRAQAHGTYKLVFNALLGSTEAVAPRANGGER